MIRFIGMCIIITAGFAVFASPAAAQAQEDNVSSEREIKTLIEQLGADFYEEREAAQKRLIEIGRPAVPYLRKNSEHLDPEVCVRIAAILKRIRWRLPASLEKILGKEVFDKLESFQEQTERERVNLLRRLVIAAPSSSVSFCINVLLYEKNKDAIDIALKNAGKNALPEHIPDLKACLKTGPNYIIVVTLADLLMKEGRDSEAVGFFERALKLNPKNKSINRPLALLYVRLKMWDKSAEFNKQLLKSQPGNVFFLERLGDACWEMGKKKEAIAAWREIAGKNPKSEMAWLKLAEIFTRRGMPKLSEEVLEKGAKTFHTHRFFYRLALWKAERGEKDAAIVLLHKARRAAQFDHEFAAIHAESLHLVPD